MKVNEVRHGNLVCDSSNKTRVVEHASELGNSLWFKPEIGVSVRHYSSLDLCNGIFLTEEAAEQFGFQRGASETQSAYYHKKVGGHDFCIRIYRDRRGFDFCLGNECNSAYVLKQYIHQLQNLFFALTGEELVKTKK